MLAGCGGSQPPIGTAASMQKAATKKIFNYTGHKQTLVVRQSSAAGHSLQRWLR
jgi:ribosomal protein L28